MPTDRKPAFLTFDTPVVSTWPPPLPHPHSPPPALRVSRTVKTAIIRGLINRGRLTDMTFTAGTELKIKQLTKDRKRRCVWARVSYRGW